MAEPRIFRRNVMSDTLKNALILAKIGIPVFPCAINKRPTCPHGFKDASSEPTAVAALWRDHPGPLIGVPTGLISNIFVLDLDTARHPEAEEWLERHAPYLPDTRQHRTQSGGLHILFRHHEGLKCSTSKLARGVDTRGDGGYVIWWPASVKQAEDCTELGLEPVPEWMVKALTPPPIPPARIIPRRSDDGGALVTARLRGIVETIEGAREGERNNVVFWAANRVRDMVVSGEIDSGAFSEVIEAARRTGLPDYEIKNTLKRTARAG
jgi:hypothetical protein